MRVVWHDCSSPCLHVWLGESETKAVELNDGVGDPEIEQTSKEHVDDDDGSGGVNQTTHINDSRVPTTTGIPRMRTSLAPSSRTSKIRSA